MKIIFVCLGSDLNAIGFRKMASLAKSIHDNIEVCYIVPHNRLSLTSILFKQVSKESNKYESVEMINKIAQSLARSEMVCISSMTLFSEYTKKIIKAIRIINPKIYIVWGGIHPIVYPEDAIISADAICTGEGENAFREFLTLYKNNEDFSNVRNFWFNINGQIKKNIFSPLQSPAEMEQFPFPLYGEGEQIFTQKSGFIPLQISDYLSINNLSYRTVWSIGCPNKCIYCSNSKFLNNDINYSKIRYPSVDYIIKEIKNAIRIHPHISNVCFADDSFMTIPLNVIEEFAKQWKEQINIPFYVGGLFPIHVNRDKIEVLLWAGMNRVRMGIQSGSDRILKFYKRPNPPGSIKKAVIILGDYTKYMIPPAYDIIVDNPIEETKDLIDTLKLMYEMPRPYTFQVYSLAIMPNTELSEEFTRLGIKCKTIDQGYQAVFPIISNILIYLMPIIKPPRALFNFLLKYVKPCSVPQAKFPILLFIVRALFFIDRGIAHLRFMDFSLMQGQIGYILWKLGIIGFYHKRFFKSRPIPNTVKIKV
ncbi:MAG: radical SAM protein [Nitrospirae bacterium]|nr:radical SAM protein [Nitrospirota bacterium]